MYYNAAPVESVAQQPRQLVELTVPADQHWGAALEGRRQLRLARGRVQRWILRENRLLQRAQLRARLDANLLDQRSPRAPVRLERLRLPAAAVEGEHEVSTQTLAQRLLGHRRLELGTRSAWQPSASSASTFASNAIQRRSSRRAISVCANSS